MLSHAYIRLAEIALVAILAGVALFAWRAEREDRAQLALELAEATKTLTAADSRQHDRDAQLVQTLSTLAAQKREVLTPEQILRALPQQIPLPTPIALTHAPASGESVFNSDHQTPSTKGNNSTAPVNITAPQAVIPSEDLKPLYDFAIDCQACQAKLSASQGDLADEKVKTATLTKERDQAVRVAKGGSALRRIARAAKWLALGAVAGAIAARAAH